MIRLVALGITFFISIQVGLLAQQMSAKELIEKSLQVHDPKNEWKSFSDSLIFKQLRPSGEVSYRRTFIDLKKNRFSFRSNNEEGVLEYQVDKKGSRYLWNGGRAISEELKKKYRVSDERASMYQSYYLYLYGMPMKLSDPGANIDPSVEAVRFQGKDYLRIRVHYDPEVGKDIWYFYFNRRTFVLEMYQFYHDESKNDGEYIYLDGAVKFGDLRLPQSLKWYMNEDDKFLGEDVLVDSR